MKKGSMRLYDNGEYLNEYKILYYVDYFLCFNDFFYIERINFFIYELEIRNLDLNIK